MTPLKYRECRDIGAGTGRRSYCLRKVEEGWQGEGHRCTCPRQEYVAHSDQRDGQGDWHLENEKRVVGDEAREHKRVSIQ